MPARPGARGMMHGMDKPTITPQARLPGLKAELEETIERLDEAASPVELDQTVQGRISRVDAIGRQQMALASRRRLAEQLRRVHAALERVRNNSYGTCCRCREPIDPARLEADPAAPLCMDCAGALEQSR
ncbi:MAG TPA: TraR/DksA C4-type zinc finger protein [Xanthomonadaceae bacterium]|nr:TraR/DksA C4-type zinc finger protein [Xanthomonadaceae bacterium]